MSGKQLFRLILPETGKVNITTEVKHDKKKKRKNERGFWILLKKTYKVASKQVLLWIVIEKTAARSLKWEKIIATNSGPA